MATMSFPARLRALARERPDAPAVTCGERTLSRSELVDAATRQAHEIASLGVSAGDFVTIASPNSVEWFVAYVACWDVGAVPQPVSAKLPPRELAAIVELAGSKVVIGAPSQSASLLDDSVVRLEHGHVPGAEFGTEPLPDVTSPAWKAPTSGGSTGRPKLIVSGDPATWDDDAPIRFGFEPDGCLVMPGPLYHNGPGVWSCNALLVGSHVVLLERFDAEATLAAIERHHGDVVYVVPTMMKRILRLDDDVRLGYDLSSLRVLWHLAEPCPPWLKEAYIDWLGPDVIHELYAGTEGQAVTIITGAEWLDHRGSVGRVSTGEMKVCDADGEELPAGEEGEVWMRSTRDDPTYLYVGAEPRTLEGGWESLGDMGWFDADGYLYLGDRVADMILSGGANIYPAEVEAAIGEHPEVHSCAVIGIPSDDRGSDVHAIVQADEARVPRADLLEFLGERLTRYKIPRTIEYVDTPMRDDAGKVRRSALRADRSATAS
ncbi:AMP-binding protein [Ilumatobacter sp.]|uniref:AMP-binding protein n=1 Tax=Ilumatobacter sp. TaxID=1967498 RepID=UPI003B51628A